MRIVIAGAGEVGFYLAKMMSEEAQDIYLIDQNQDRLQYVLDHLDVYGVRGSANDLNILKESKISSSDLFIAATSSEETNLLVSILAKKLGAKKVIARVHDFKSVGKGTVQFYKDFGIDNLISPVNSAIKEIERILMNPLFTETYEFEEGKLTVFGIVVGEDSPIAGKLVIQTAYLNPNLSFRAFALRSPKRNLIIKKDTVIEANDTIYFISTPESLSAIPKFCKKNNIDVKNLMILGGSNLGVLTAERIQKKFNVTLIEKDKQKAEKLAEKLTNTLVINADVRNIEVLREENLDSIDVFLAATNDSETNIISSIFAKKEGVKKTIAKVSNIEYMGLSHNMGIDTLINEKMIVANQIMAHIMEKSVNAIADIPEIESEIIEYIVDKDHEVTKCEVKKLKLPPDSLIIGAIRENKGFVPFGGFRIKSGDKIICYARKSSMAELTAFFS